MLAMDLSAQAKREIDRQVGLTRDTLETADATEVKDLQGRIKGLRQARDIITEIIRRNEIDDDD